MLNFTRQTNAKLELLREVVEKVRNGEDVDVKQALGTGDPHHEKEWEQVMRELEETDMLLEGRKKREAKRAQKEQQRRVKEEEGNRAAQSPAETQKTSRPKFFM
jgi:septum formation inhibitor MinC